MSTRKPRPMPDDGTDLTVAERFLESERLQDKPKDLMGTRKSTHYTPRQLKVLRKLRRQFSIQDAAETYLKEYPGRGVEAVKQKLRSLGKRKTRDVVVADERIPNTDFTPSRRKKKPHKTTDIFQSDRVVVMSRETYDALCARLRAILNDLE